MQDNLILNLQKELDERPTFKRVEDLQKQVKILQVASRNGGDRSGVLMQYFLCTEALLVGWRGTNNIAS